MYLCLIYIILCLQIKMYLFHWLKTICYISVIEKIMFIILFKYVGRYTYHIWILHYRAVFYFNGSALDLVVGLIILKLT